MAQVLVTDTYLTNIANAIRSKKEVNDTYTPAEMANAILSIPVGGAAAPLLQSKSVSPSTVAQTISPDTGYDGLSSVAIGAVTATTLDVYANGDYSAANGNFYSSVHVAIEDSKVNLQSKTATPGTDPVAITPDTGYHGLSSVIVEAIPSIYADVHNTTATANDVLSGKTFISADGRPRTGLLVTSSYYVGSTVPDGETGENGDLYLRI